MVKPATAIPNFVAIEVNPVVFPLPRPMVVVVPVFRFKVFLAFFSHFLVYELIFFVVTEILVVLLLVFPFLVFFSLFLFFKK